jgi:Vacuolar sorting protein 9 (VPS9) domain
METFADKTKEKDDDEVDEQNALHGDTRNDAATAEVPTPEAPELVPEDANVQQEENSESVVVAAVPLDSEIEQVVEEDANTLEESVVSNFGSFDLSDDAGGGAANVTTGLFSTEHKESIVAVTAEESLGPKSVSTHRKEELLLQARSDRLRWVQQVPLPYETINNTDTAETSRFGSFLRYSHVTQLVPSVRPILKHLYGNDDGYRSAEIVLTHSEQDEFDLATMTGNQILAAEIDACQDEERKEFLELYQTFLMELQDPSCGTTVQGMRNFCRNFQDLTDPEAAASRLKAYVTATSSTLAQHDTVFKDNDRLLHFAETFLFGQCQEQLQNLFWTQEAREKDNELEAKLETLQFLTPLHLDIACLADKDPDVLIQGLLAQPLAVLQSVDSFFSVYEKLQQILRLYRGVNVALTAAMQANSEKLPSADDVLPTIIYTVVKAQPRRLFYNLKVIEDMSPPEYLRGEAGYAFTNLYGAVQFLQDLDLTKESTSLTISKESLQEALTSRKKAMERRMEESSKRKTRQEILIKPEPLFTAPSPHDIRSARLRGEKIDLDWALKWQEDHGVELEQPTLPSLAQQSGIDDVEQILPAGFRRNYSYLTVRPEDVRVNDLPMMLDEYRMLVRATETLLGERASRAAAERKAKSKATEQAFATDLIPDAILAQIDAANK